MTKTYNVKNKEEAKKIIVKIIMEKVREIVGDKPIRIKLKGDTDE